LLDIALKQLQKQAYELGIKSLEVKEPILVTPLRNEPIDLVNIIKEFKQTLK
jgi:hypothetical protein